MNAHGMKLVASSGRHFGNLFVEHEHLCVVVCSNGATRVPLKSAPESHLSHGGCLQAHDAVRMLHKRYCSLRDDCCSLRDFDITRFIFSDENPCLQAFTRRSSIICAETCAEVAPIVDCLEAFIQGLL